MIKALKTLIGAAQRSDATVDELAVSVRDADNELQAARTALAHAQEVYQGGLLNPDDAYLRRLSDARTEAQIRVDRAEAIAATLAERHTVAIEREAEAVRLQKYEAAKRQAAEVRALLLEMYPAAATTIADILRALAEGEIVVQAANKDLPAGMEPIPGIEASVRAIPGSPSQLVSEIEVERWCFPGDGRPDAVGQDHVEVQPDGSGLLRHSRGGVEHLVKRKFIERRHSAYVSAEVPDHLAVSINLPGVGAKDTAFFAPLDRIGRTDPGTVLKHLDRPRAVAASPTKAPETVKYELVGTVNAEAERRRYAGLLDRITGRV